MRTGAIVLARMTSDRLSGKVLRHLAGKPLIDHVIDRALRITLADQVVVATSIDAEDDVLACHCEARGVDVFRGSRDDVAGRVLECARFWGWRYFARVNGDSPFIDPGLIDIGLEQALVRDMDFVTNICPRTFPYGVAVEVMKTGVFEHACHRITRDEDREHVTAFFYRRLHELRHLSLTADGENTSDIRLTVDDEDDIVRMETLMRRLGARSAEASLAEIIAAYRKLWPAEQVPQLVGA